MSVARSFSTYVPWLTYTFQQPSRIGLTHAVSGLAGGVSYAICVGYQSASGPNTNAKGRISYTSDGKIWSPVSTTSFGNNSVNVVAYGNGTFVAAGHGNTIATAAESAITSWTQRTSPIAGTTNYWKWAKYIDGKFWLQGSSNNNLYYSTDGITWSQGAGLGETLRVNDAVDYQTRGDLFYFGSTVQYPWVAVYGKPFQATSTAHAAILIEGATQSAVTRVDVTESNAGSQWPLYFDEDKRLLIKVSETTATMSNRGFHQQIVVNTASVTTGDIPVGYFPLGSNRQNLHPWFPNLNSVDVQAYENVAANASQINTNVYTQGVDAAGLNVAYSRAHYDFSDGYYNCIFPNSGYGGIMNVAFSPQTLLRVAPPQVMALHKWGSIDSDLYGGGAGWGYAHWTRFKGMSIGAYNPTGVRNNVEGYFLGVPTVRSMETTTTYK